MNLKKTLLSVLMILQLCLLVGVTILKKRVKVDDPLHSKSYKSKIEGA